MGGWIFIVDFMEVIILLMSEQIDGFLDMKASYNFDRSKNAGYRSKTIEAPGFHQWTKDHMYKSSYAHFHSKVHLASPRTPPTPRTARCRATQGTSPQSRPKTSTPRATPPWRNRASTRRLWGGTPSACPPPASTSTATPSSTPASWPRAASTARQKSRGLTRGGM
jgi:hypothetical protein